MASEKKKQGTGKRTLILLILCGVLGLSCPICILGTRVLKPSEQKKGIRTAEKLLEEGKVVEAEKKFKELGEYEKHKKDIEAKKKEKHAELLREANKAYAEKDFELARKLYREARNLGKLDEDTEAKYKRAEVLLLKEAVPKYLYDARGHFEGVNYDTALEEANKAIEGCGTLEENAPDVANEVNTKKIRKEALALKDRIEKEKKKAEREKAIREMESYEKDSGDIGVAVYGCKLSKTVSTGYGFYEYVTGDSRYVWLGIAVINYGSTTTHVNPNDFTLSTPTGYTSSHDSVTYSLGNYFDAVNLPSGGSTNGWIIFISFKEDHYRLNYESWGNTATKKIYVTEGK